MNLGLYRASVVGSSVIRDTNVTAVLAPVRRYVRLRVSPPMKPAALISLTQSHVHVLVAALALVVYDTILSFSQEFRYGTIINIALQVLDGSGVTNVVIG
ncbi:hypothetical protein QCA50_008222 [Cerrena zonata]|uniref:DUF6533 domain-containing protein n=1 Tax=Cerrena zonata TaxID=2478898 RepID=A0AAW0GBJ5_9APHY